MCVCLVGWQRHSLSQPSNKPSPEPSFTSTPTVTASNHSQSLFDLCNFQLKSSFVLLWVSSRIQFQEEINNFYFLLVCFKWHLSQAPKHTGTGTPPLPRTITDTNHSISSINRSNVGQLKAPTNTDNTAVI